MLEAFELFYRCSTPNWADLQYQLNPREKMGMDEEQRRQFRKRAWDAYDCAQRVANQRFRKRLTEGSFAAFVRDPMHGQTLKLPRDGWDELGEFENGITANFVGPDDPINRGPNTVVEGKRRPVIYVFAVYLVEGEPESGEGAGADQASGAGVAGAKGQANPTERTQWKRAERYIKKHYPDGTDGISTSVIHRKLTKDKDLKAELEKEGAPGRAFADRDQSRAPPPQKVTRQNFWSGHAQRCPNSSRS